ncbi:hypothetical protein [Variovorax terrae]|uniref:Lipoprotein n=1 Tax=Variovorax terrae TaxID=2923278 RepID=A0A9X1VWQ2_9BURK|nr:hypothetical protein [Variovorax terrae]MCJ0765176.1 hypothetical protein [Variovorax terrae]
MAAALLALAACTEKPQTAGGGHHGAPAYAGTGSNFTAAGWKPGDKTSWEQEIKARMQRGQNEYNKTN